MHCSTISFCIKMNFVLSCYTLTDHWFFIILSNERRALITKCCNDSWSSLASSNVNKTFSLLSEAMIGNPWVTFCKKLPSKQGSYFSSKSCVSPQILKHVAYICVVFQTKAQCQELLATELCLKSLCMVGNLSFIVQWNTAPCHHRRGWFQE